MKKQKFQSISISYNHGYYIFFQPVEQSFYFSFGATFQQMERAKEYIEFQAGKTIAKKFDPWFDSVKETIIKDPNFTRQEGFLLNLKK